MAMSGFAYHAIPVIYLQKILREVAIILQNIASILSGMGPSRPKAHAVERLEEKKLSSLY